MKVPPYHDQHITLPVSVGIYVVTNAGRSHDVQPFTYTPDPGMLKEKHLVAQGEEMILKCLESPLSIVTYYFNQGIIIEFTFYIVAKLLLFQSFQSYPTCQVWPKHCPPMKS